MEMNYFQNVAIEDSSQIAAARRLAAHFTKRANFSEVDAGKVAIAVTEAATNQLKHAGGGEILLRLTEHNDVQGVEILAIDKGPGIANVRASIEDGYSTSGSPGTGLGAIKRQSSYFDIYSATSKGTVLLMQFWAKPLPPSVIPRRTEIGSVAVPIRGEDVCGDGWAVKQFVDSILLLLADGLGHGVLAAEASNEARRLFHQQTDTAPGNILKTLHLGMKSTRGAAAAVMEANALTGLIRYAGVGNTAAFVAGLESQRNMVSLNGTIGVQSPKMQEFSYEWPQDALLIFTTDGLVSQPTLKDYPGLFQRHCTVIAAVLYRDFNRGRDDATAVVIRRKAA